MHEPHLEDLASSDWSRLTVGQMWEALGEVDQGAAIEQAAGWVNAFELLDHHHARLQEYRDLIARTWRGVTADAFLREVDGLMAAVTTMRDAAIANEGVLPHLSSSIAEAREQLAPIHQQWTASRSAVPSRSDPHPAAVSNGAQDQLHRQAVGVMTTLSSRVIEGYRAVKIPPQYTPPRNIGPQSHDPALTSPSAGSGEAGSFRRTTVSQAPGSAPAQGGGPALAGGQTAPVTPQSGTGSVPVISTSEGPQPVVGRIIGLVPGAIRNGVGSSSFDGVIDGDSGVSRPGARAMPRGGVINGPIEEIEPARPVAATPRINPVGGVIGPTTGRETEGMFAPPIGGSGARQGEQRRTRNPEYDSDEYWPRPTGVPPVITSRADEPVHDPGPVIGLPRKNRAR